MTEPRGRELKDCYEREAETFSHQEALYLKTQKHELWWHRKRLSYVLSYLGDIFKSTHVKTFVDVGCAEGLYMKWTAPYQVETFFVGVDIARAYVKKARANVPTQNSDFVVCDIARLPFRDGGIDVVLCSEVLEHLFRYLDSLSELDRIAKKYLVLSFPGHSYLYHIMSRIGIAKKFADSLVIDVGHVSEVHVNVVTEFLEGKYRSVNIRIGGSLPLLLFKMISSIRLVEIIDELICKILRFFGALDYATIHVMKIAKK